MALDVYFVSNIENLIAGNLHQALEGGASVEYCRGVISCSRSVILSVGGDWKRVERIVFANLAEGKLQQIIDNNIPLIGESK